MSKSGKHHIVSYKTYTIIWVLLLILTTLSVLAVEVDFGTDALAIGAALFIATVKSLLVAIYFMHLKFDKKVIAVMVTASFFVFVIFIVLTFFDYAFR